MQKEVTITSPSTLEFETMPCSRVIVYLGNQIYYDRPFDPSVTKFEFNIPDKGHFLICVDAERVISCKRVPLKPNKKKIVLPPHEKEGSKLSGYHIEFNPTQKSPARVNVHSGVIQINDRFKGLPIYAKKFIIFHELGHRFYKTEFFCDLYAAKCMLDRGYNQSSCLMAMKNSLHSTPTNESRMENVFGALTN